MWYRFRVRVVELSSSCTACVHTRNDPCAHVFRLRSKVTSISVLQVFKPRPTRWDLTTRGFRRFCNNKPEALDQLSRFLWIKASDELLSNHIPGILPISSFYYCNVWSCLSSCRTFSVFIWKLVRKLWLLAAQKSSKAPGVSWRSLRTLKVFMYYQKRSLCTFRLKHVVHITLFTIYLWQRRV